MNYTRRASKLDARSGDIRHDERRIGDKTTTRMREVANRVKNDKRKRERKNRAPSGAKGTAKYKIASGT